MNNRKNQLTLFLDNGKHSFIGLKCESCSDDGNPVEIKAGFYPGSDIQCDDVIRENRNDNAQKIQNSNNKLQSTLVPTVVLPNVFKHPGPFISGAGSAIIAVPKLIDFNQQNYNVLNEEGMDGKTICNASKDGINFARYSKYFEKDFKDIYSVSYEISDEDSKKIYDEVKRLAENCVDDYQYNQFSYNCLDFVRTMYGLTSLEKKSFSGIYNLNPISSLAYGHAGMYMLGRDVLEMSSANPALVLCGGYALYGLYKWTSNKMSRSFGSKFDPENITKMRRKKDKKLIRDLRDKIEKMIQVLQEPLNSARDKMNDCYGVASRKDEYPILRGRYVSIREFLKECNETLDKLNQLAKDYNSLSTEYSCTRYANQILYKTRTLMPMICLDIETKFIEICQDIETEFIGHLVAIHAEKERESQATISGIARHQP